MTEIADNGDLVQRPRQTQWSRYPLPPDNGRFKPSWNRYKQYTLPHPGTGRPTAFSRATTIAKTLDDRYNLELWTQRKLARAILDGVRLQMRLADPLSEFAKTTDHERAIDATMVALWGEDPTGQQFNTTMDHLDNLTGGADSTEFGQAVHEWCEALDLGIVRPCEVPDVFTEHCRVYRGLLKRHALYPVPAYTERIVLNDQTPVFDENNVLQSFAHDAAETVVGTLDRIFRVITTGKLVLGDVKTTKADSLDWGVLNFCIQLAIYRFARLMLSLDGRKWDTMPVLDTNTAYLIHLPNDDAQKAACIALDTRLGSEGMQLALRVRELRKRGKRSGLSGTIPIPSPDALQWAQARHEIQDITGPDELPMIWERYQSVWTDELTTLGRQIADLITTSELVS